MDSYQKFALDVIGPKESFFTSYIEPEDLDEVWVFFADMVCGLQYNDNYRVRPMHMKKEYDELRRRGCCGFCDSSIRCKSGNVYLVGCNYGH